MKGIRLRFKSGGVPLIAAVVAIVFGVLSAGPIVMVLVTPPPLTYPGQPWSVEGPIYPGDVILVHAVRCNNEWRNLPYSFDRQIVSEGPKGHVYAVPAGGAFAPPGCHGVESRLNAAPYDLPPGRYHLEGVSTARGVWQTSIVNWRTKSFVVLSR